MPWQEQCGPDPTSHDLPGSHDCADGAGKPDASFYWHHPGKVRPDDTRSRGGRPPDVSRGFNFAMILLPYSRDWGRSLGIVRRRKALPTAMHSFARVIDRAYALQGAEAFYSRFDSYEQPFCYFLCHLNTFVGFRWNAHLLLKWQDRAEQNANDLGAPKSLTLDAAFDAAISWCGADHRNLWDLYTRERFPFSAPDLVQWWSAPVAAALPAADREPAQLDATP